MAIREAPRVSALQASEEIYSGLIGIVLEPTAHFWPDLLERIYVGSPSSGRAGFPRMGRADFAGLPRECEAGEELSQIRVADRRCMHSFPFGHPGQMVLHSTNLIEQSQRIEALGEILEPRLDLGRDTLRRQQARGR